MFNSGSFTAVIHVKHWVIYGGYLSFTICHLRRLFMIDSRPFTVVIYV